MRLGLSKLLGKPFSKYASNKGTLKERLAEKKIINDAYLIFVSDCLYKSICCGYSFELPRLVEAIQMSTHNICFYEKVDANTLDVT